VTELSELTRDERPVVTRDFVAIVMTQMMFGYAISTFLLLPKFLATQLHGTASQIGHVSAIPGCTAALIVPFVGSALAHCVRCCGCSSIRSVRPSTGCR